MDEKSSKLAAAYIYIGIAAVSIGVGGAYRDTRCFVPDYERVRDHDNH